MKLFNLLNFTFFLFLFFSISSFAQSQIERKELLSANLGSCTIQKVDVREINFQPKQITGYHKHPCPVVGYIVSGTILFQVEGDSSKILKAGDAFFEPADTPIAHFDNISDKETAKFIAYYLLNGEVSLIEMLSKK